LESPIDLFPRGKPRGMLQISHLQSFQKASRSLMNIDCLRGMLYDGWIQKEQKMKVTVCELGNDPEGFSLDWKRLAAHVKKAQSELVLLPEMPFYPWFAWSPEYDPATWQAAVQAHQDAESLLRELSPAIVCGSRPVNRKGKRHNEAFVWNGPQSFQPAHTKYYLPNEEGYWEASWYERGDKDFSPLQVGDAFLGFVICTDLWFFEHSRSYGKKGVHLIACPRATPKSTLDKWLAGGQAAAVVSGAFLLSSNRISREEEPADLGGQGWIVGPNGKILGTTSPEMPFLTLDLDLRRATEAKHTYPRYVSD
jgi:N-carbamoylputrescine amidase